MEKVEKDRVILGIDPGTNIMGYGVIHEKGKTIECVGFGVVDMRKLDGHFNKLKHIYERTIQLIDGFKPDELAIESPFQGKNVQSMLKLGRAQGAAISAALTRTIPIYEYAPRKIKLAITGSGAASKEQVAGMLQKLLKLEELPKELDATDGLAAAMCHYYQKEKITSDSKIKNWKDYVDRKNIEY
ncbi:MAG: crossover junction endodeoxyribonuclease RuvC [Bacteroidota bacterium]|jgi:crossover junction endodeoxyribonuclease RuvC|nr:crossover junction endodeoxyribonuclease RuvC [Bacteroidota bacterium]OQC45772.1 MAG: Crossover junction endodeoxyribonuclease RuvC [Bacteroidetes bacterium ADurb.Bin028]HNY44214.1 crossover junction endodeoxyribonuclease RuvC [Bacteroidales bacterium]HOD88729.1 crossover junction endodeoxyribonuclease RuvC [Bacteroidales bacterium]